MGENGAISAPQMGHSQRLLRVRATGGRRGNHALKPLSVCLLPDIVLNGGMVRLVLCGVNNKLQHPYEV